MSNITIKYNYIRNLINTNQVVNCTRTVLNDMSPLAFIIRNLPQDDNLLIESRDLLNCLINKVVALSISLFKVTDYFVCSANYSEGIFIYLWNKLIANNANIFEVKPFGDETTTLYTSLPEYIMTFIRDPLCKQMIETLICAGINVNQKGSVFSLPYYAITNSRADTLSLLLSNGAELSTEEANKAIEQTTNYAIISILMNANITLYDESLADALSTLITSIESCRRDARLKNSAEMYKTQLVRCLQMGINPNCYGRYHEAYPLEIALYSNQVDIVNILLRYGAIVYSRMASEYNEFKRKHQF